MGVATALFAIRPAITDGDDPRELLVTVQTSRDVPAIAERLAEAQAAGTLRSVLIDDRDSGAWPWVWYLHEMTDVMYVAVDPSQPLPPGHDAYIVSASGVAPIVPDGFVIERFVLRGWSAARLRSGERR